MPTTYGIYTKSFLRELLTESGKGVDKTLSIKKILEIPQKAVLINGPRGCGKSTMIDMLYRFLGIQVYVNGDELSVNTNRELFTKGKLAPLKIFTEHPEYMKYQGEFPVISISFQSRSISDYNELKSFLDNAISCEISEYGYLMESPKLTDLQKDKYRKYVTTKLDDGELIDSLRFLSEVLSIHHERKVYVLLDEYDTPLSSFITPSLDNLNVLLDPEKIKEMDGAVKLYSSILNACVENNPYLEKLVIVGVLDVSQSLQGQGFRDMRVLKISDAELSGCFGFSYEDVIQLVSKFEFYEKDAKRIMDHIKKLYMGYNVRGSSGETMEVGLPLPITLSLSSFDKEGTIDRNKQHFWLSSGISNILGGLNSHELPSSIFDKLKKLTYGGSVELNLTPEFNLIDALKELQIPDLTSEKNEMLLESVVAHNLFYSGYITQNPDGSFRVPTAEVQYAFESKVLEYWIYKTLGSTSIGDDSKALVTALNKGDFAVELQQRVLDKIRGADEEEELGALIGAMIDYAGHRYSTMSNSKVRFSRVYNVFYPISCMGFPLLVEQDDTSRAIIHRYTNLYIQDLSEKEKIKERILNKLLWQAFESRDVANLLSERDSIGYGKRCNKVKIRAVIFIHDETSKKWSVEIKEKEFGVGQVRTIQEFLDNELVKELLTGPIENFKKAMRDLKLDPKNIDSLLKNIIEDHEDFLEYLSENKTAAALAEVPTEIIPSGDIMQKRIIVFDIDGVLCHQRSLYSYDKINETAIREAYPEHPLMSYKLESSRSSYISCFLPYLDVLFDYLISKNCRIVFFSAGPEERNNHVITELMRQVIGLERYEDLKKQGQFEIFSQQHLRRTDKTRGEHGQNIKDMKQVIREGEILDNAVLIEDQSSFTAKDQRPCISAMDLERWGFYHLSEGEFSRNGAYYLIGLFEMLLEIPEYSSLTLRRSTLKLFRTDHPIHTGEREYFSPGDESAYKHSYKCMRLTLEAICLGLQKVISRGYINAVLYRIKDPYTDRYIKMSVEDIYRERMREARIKDDALTFSASGRKIHELVQDQSKIATIVEFINNHQDLSHESLSRCIGRHFREIISEEQIKDLREEEIKTLTSSALGQKVHELIQDKSKVAKIVELINTDKGLSYRYLAGCIKHDLRENISEEQIKILKEGIPQKRIIVFDIDGVLCHQRSLYSHDKINETAIREAYPEHPLMSYKLESSRSSYISCFLPYLDVLFDYLISKNCRIVFFSAVTEERNNHVITELMRQVIGLEKYEDLKKQGQFEIFSQQHLRRADDSKGEYGNFIKDMKQVVKEGEDIDNAVLIEDQSSYTAKDQRPCISAMDLESWGFYHLSKDEFSRNGAYYLIGLFKMLFDIPEYAALTLRQSTLKLFRREYPIKLGKFGSDRYPQEVFYPGDDGFRPKGLTLKAICHGIKEVKERHEHAKLHELERHPELIAKYMGMSIAEMYESGIEESRIKHEILIDSAIGRKIRAQVPHRADVATVVKFIIDHEGFKYSHLSGLIQQEFRVSVSEEEITFLIDLEKTRLREEEVKAVAISAGGAAAAGADIEIPIDNERKRLREEDEVSTGSEGGAGAAGVVALRDSSEMEPKMRRIQTKLGAQSQVLFCRIEYENPFYNYPRIGEVFKKANEIGGGELVKFVADMSNNKKAGAQLITEFNNNGINNTLNMINKAINVTPTLYLDTIIGRFNLLIKAVNSKIESVGSLIYKAQELINEVLDRSTEGDKEVILTTLLLDIVDAVNTQGHPMFIGRPWRPGDGPDDFSSGGGGDDRGPSSDGLDRGQFPMSFNYSNPNSQLAGVNESLE